MREKPICICEWPGCDTKAIYVSGNAGGAMVCSKHAKITNGKSAKELTEHEHIVIELMCVKVQMRTLFRKLKEHSTTI